MSKKKAVLYTRCSTEEQGRKGNSLETQMMFLKQKASSFQIVEEITEVVSGFKKAAKRTALERLYQKCKRKKGYTDYILFQKVDRFSRNTMLAWEWIGKFQEIGIEINFVDQWIPYGSGSEILLLNTYLSIGQTESLNTQKRTKDNIFAIKSKGYFANAFAPVGYIKMPLGDRNTLVNDGTDKLSIIRKCFQMYLYAEITRFSMQKAFIDKLGIKKTSFYSLFHNPIYAGYNKVNDEYYKGNWKGIITLEEFKAIQEKIQKEGRNQKKLATTSKSESFYLKGFIRDEQHQLMTASTTTKRLANGTIKKHPYYSSRTKGLGRIKRDIAHNVFDKFLKSFKMTKESQAKLIRAIRSKLDSPIRSIRSKTATIQKEIESLEKRLNEIKSDYINKVIEPIDYKEIKAAILEKKENLILEIESVKEKQGFKLSDIDNIVKSITSLHAIFKKASNTEKSTLIGCLMPKGFVLDVELSTVRTDYINSMIAQLFDLQNVNVVIAKENGMPNNDIPFGGGRANQFRTDIDAIHKIVEIYKKVA